MSVLSLLKNGLIVSCQALANEPLYGEDTMAKMALAAKQGGAVGIRANTAEDIRSIKSKVKLPLIGLWKQDYSDSEVYITPTVREVDAVLEAGSDIVAIDATRRYRPNGERLDEITAYIRSKYSCLMMADISTLEEGLYAEQLGFDMVSTTLSGYTPYSRQQVEPDFQLLQELVSRVSIPVIAEGRIHSPEQVIRCFELGAFAVVVGSAITRPQLITHRYVNEIHQFRRRCSISGD